MASGGWPGVELWFGAVVIFLAAYGLVTMVYGTWHWVQGRGRRREAPFVSLLLLVRNQEDVIEGVVRDLLGIAGLNRSGLSNYELVAVDDGSSDTTGQILERLARVVQSTRVARVDRPGHPSDSAVSVGLFHCRSRVVVLLDLRGPLRSDELVQAARYLLGERRGQGD